MALAYGSHLIISRSGRGREFLLISEGIRAGVQKPMNFPGGKPMSFEADGEVTFENAADTLIREVSEETGLNLELTNMGVKIVDTDGSEITTIDPSVTRHHRVAREWPNGNDHVRPLIMPAVLTPEEARVYTSVVTSFHSRVFHALRLPILNHEPGTLSGDTLFQYPVGFRAHFADRVPAPSGWFISPSVDYDGYGYVSTITTCHLRKGKSLPLVHRVGAIYGWYTSRAMIGGIIAGRIHIQVLRHWIDYGLCTGGLIDDYMFRIMISHHLFQRIAESLRAPLMPTLTPQAITDFLGIICARHDSRLKNGPPVEMSPGVELFV